MRVRVGVRAQRSQLGCGVRQTDHRHRSRIVLAVERRWLSYVEAARSRVLWIVKPEAEVESIDGRRIALVCVETENLVEKNRVQGP